MATESAVRLIGSSGASNWPLNKDAVVFNSSTTNVAAQELGFLLDGPRFHEDGKVTGPNRCGSAPPSIEGSLLAAGNLRDQQNSSLDGSLENLTLAVESCNSEEQLRSHPAYLAYYCSNVNLNPRLPPPLISQENRRLVHHIGGFTDNWRMPSFDDNYKGSSFISRSVLSTHKEEPEDDMSPRVESDDWTDKSTGFLSQCSTSPLQGRHKTVMDIIQEDFPRTPSPVYRNQARLLDHTGTEQAEQDGLILTSRDLEQESGIVGGRICTPKPFVGSVGLLPNSDVPAPSPAFSDRTVSPHRGLKGMSSSSDAIIDNGGLAEKATGSNTGRVDNKTTNLKSSDVQCSQHARTHPQYGCLISQGTSSQGPTQTVAPGMHHSNSAMGHFSHGQSKSSVELQAPLLQSISITPPMYATASPYGTPYYPSLQPSSLISSPFGVGGYALNPSLMTPVISGYPPHNAIPIPLDSHVSPNFNARNSGVSTGASVAPGVDFQHLYKFYGQLGLIQPSFLDPSYTPYFQHPSVDVYAGAGRYDSVVSGRNTVMSPQGTYDTQVGSSLASYSPDQRPNVLHSGGINTSNAARGGTISPNYYGSPQNIGVVMQSPNSPLVTPMYQGSPEVGTSYTGRKFENVKSPVSSGRSAGIFSGWQGQKGRGKVDEPKPYSFLEEMKSNKGRRFELSDISGHVLVFSADQHGSRFIQQKLETCSAEEKESVFKEVLPHASALMTDVFGNYVIQKFFEHGSPEQRKKLARQLTGHILPLSLQMYGCRVIQKALDVIELEQKTQLVHELDGHVMRCVRDQNGNHVIQKCIECVPTDKIGFIISAFRGQVAALSMHPYGCRVIQRVLEHCTDELQSQCVVDEILQSVCSLAEDQYGNYVTQHVLERGNPHERSQIINKLAGQVVQMSQHKFASNVIEKCLEHGAAAEREILIEEIVGQTEGNDNLLIMMKDQYANYVVQKILETCSDKQRDILLNRIKVHLQALKKYTYGKHIVARVEQLSEESCPTVT